MYEGNSKARTKEKREGGRGSLTTNTPKVQIEERARESPFVDEGHRWEEGTGERQFLPPRRRASHESRRRRLVSIS